MKRYHHGLTLFQWLSTTLISLPRSSGMLLHKDIKNLCFVPSTCHGCGAPFDLSHALVCRKGGLVTQRHNEICDALGDLSSLAWSQVIREPMVKKANFLSGSPTLVTELSVRGVLGPSV